MDNGTILGLILSSSVVSSLATAFFSHLSNRKNNTLSHITNERKLWREKIRDLAAKIQDCEYQASNEKNINKYLVQLKVNINPYGKGKICDFKHDSHIWMEIDELEAVTDEINFKKHKELLIDYLSFMLKEDWERSKREIKGISALISELLSFSAIFIWFWYLFNIKYKEYGLDELIMMSILTGLILFVVPKFIFPFPNIDIIKYGQINYVFRIINFIYFCFGIIIFLSYSAYLYFIFNDFMDDFDLFILILLAGIEIIVFFLNIYCAREREYYIVYQITRIRNDKLSKIQEYKDIINDWVNELDLSNNFDYKMKEMLILQNIALKNYKRELIIRQNKYDNNYDVESYKNYKEIESIIKDVDKRRKLNKKVIKEKRVFRPGEIQQIR